MALDQLDHVHERALSDGGQRDEHGRFDDVGDHRLTRITTSERASKSTNGSTWTRAYRSMSCRPTLVTVPLRMLYGGRKERSPSVQPGVTTVSPTLTTSDLSTRSRTSQAALGDGLTIPRAGVSEGSGETTTAET